MAPDIFLLRSDLIDEAYPSILTAPRFNQQYDPGDRLHSMSIALSLHQAGHQENQNTDDCIFVSAH